MERTRTRQPSLGRGRGRQGRGNRHGANLGPVERISGAVEPTRAQQRKLGCCRATGAAAEARVRWRAPADPAQIPGAVEATRARWRARAHRQPKLGRRGATRARQQTRREPLGGGGGHQWRGGAAAVADTARREPRAGECLPGAVEGATGAAAKARAGGTLGRW